MEFSFAQSADDAGRFGNDLDFVTKVTKLVALRLLTHRDAVIWWTVQSEPEQEQDNLDEEDDWGEGSYSNGEDDSSTDHDDDDGFNGYDIETESEGSDDGE